MSLPGRAGHSGPKEPEWHPTGLKAQPLVHPQNPSQSRNLWIGQPPPIPKPNWFRILTTNLNGINSGHIFDFVADIFTQAKSFDADFVGFTAPNVDFLNNKVRQDVFDSIRKTKRESKVGFATSKILSNTTFKPGGILSAALGYGFHRCSKIYADQRGLG